MSEELLQRDLQKNPEKIGKWDFYNIGATSVKALKEYGIIRNINYGKEERKKVDALIVQQKNVIAVIEYKKPSEFKTKAQKNKAIKQEIEVAKKIGSNIIIATDTKESVWVNVETGNRIKDEDGKELKYNFNPKDENLPELIDKIISSINEINDQLKPKKLVNPTDLAKQIWQDIWSVSGATPENCLYTFVELFIFKYLSDLGILGQGINFDHLQERYNYNIPNPNEEALEYYANTIRPQIKRLFKEGNDGTTIINGTIFVSKTQKAVRGYSTVFKKVLGKFKDYGKLEYIDKDFKSQLFESFLKESISKKNWGQFFTPLKVIRAITEMAKDDIKVGSKICDPACGVGKFLLEPIFTKLDKFYEVKNGKLKPKIIIRGYDKGFDKDEQKTIILAKANMLIYLSDLLKENPNITNEFADLFNESFELKTNSILGTLSDPVENEYDLILTNPPYVTSGSSNLKDEVKKDGELVNYFKVNAMGVEGLFMEWIIRALKPNGKAFIVVPDGIFNRQNDKNLRQFLIEECFIDGIISLPTKTFFTTPKKTYILAITKKANKKDTQSQRVFTYLASEIGESRDVYRFDIEQNDLQEAVKLYRGFKGSPDYFIENNSDKRCKVQPFEKFDPSANWSIDRWWSREEKIELGIIEEDNKINLEELPSLLEEVSDNILSFKEEILELSEKKKSQSELKSVLLSDKNLFELSIGKRIVKRDIVNIKGTIPIYSANVKMPVGYHNKSNISNFNNNFVLWGIDGDFEFNAIQKNEPFVSTDHCGVIRIIEKDILPEYLMLQLESVKHIYGFDRGLRASLKNMKTVEIKLPINENGSFDVNHQKEAVSKYLSHTELKSRINSYKRQLKEIIVEIKNETTSKDFKITELFDILGEDNLTKKHINDNKGDYPVYSGQIENGGVFGYLNSYKYDETILTWVTYGNSGHILKRSGKFNIGRNNCGLRPKHNTIDLDYIKYVAQPLFIDNVKGEKQKSLPQTIVKNIKVPVPIKKDGSFDLLSQKEIAKKYLKIDLVKSEIIKELDKIINVSIDYD